MEKLYFDSHIEINGLLARYYSLILNIVTLRKYKKIIEKLVEDMNIRPEEKIIDFGAGMGYTEKFMVKYLSLEGKITGIDKSTDMVKKYKKICSKYPNVEIIKSRIDISLEFDYKYNKALISFVLHGLPHKSRLKLLKNAKNSLKKDGKLFVLDYGDFNIENLPIYFKIPFKIFECKYTFEYIKKDWKKIIEQNGFEFVKSKYYYKNIIRILTFEKI